MTLTPEEQDYMTERICIMVADGIPEKQAKEYALKRIMEERK